MLLWITNSNLSQFCFKNNKFSNVWSLKPGLETAVITETAITARTYQIFGKFNHNRNQNFYLQLTVTITINSLQKRVIIGNKKPCKKKQSVFKVAILRMLKFAQSAEYAQKNEVKVFM